MIDQAEGLRQLAVEMNEAGEEMSAKSGTRILSVASGKGGVGKSNLSVNLSIALADLGKKVLLLDADLGMANVNVILGIIPRFNLFHVIKGEKKLKEVVLSVPQGIDIIAGASGFSELADLEQSMRRKFVRGLNSLEHYDYIIIDTAAGVSQNVLKFIGASDEVLIVTTPEPTAITDAYGIIKSVVRDGFNNIRLVVNRVSNIMEGKKISDRIIRITHQFLNVSISGLGYVYDDPSVGKAVKMQDPFFRAFPSSKAAKSLSHIASIIENRSLEESERTVKNFFRGLIRKKRAKTKGKTKK